ncbi:unknown [Bacteroides sp. CAG:598]|nr:unknown [Bacteroides sp. CAG:598]
MPAYLPSFVRIQYFTVHRQAESQPRRRRIAMTKTVLAKVPHQYSYRIIAFAQALRPTKHVAIRILRIRSALQSAFPHLQFAIHPKPILAIRRDTKFHIRRFVVQVQIHAITKPHARRHSLRGRQSQNLCRAGDCAQESEYNAEYRFHILSNVCVEVQYS